MGQSYESQGIIHSIGATTEYGANGFTKREFVIKLTGEGENPEYPNHVGFELVKDKCALMDGFQIGHEIKVAFNLGGRLWAGNGNGEKCFPSLGAWKIAAVGAPANYQATPSDHAAAAPQYAPAPQMAPPPAPQMAPQPMAPAPQPMAPQPAPAPQAAPQPVIAATNHAQPQAPQPPDQVPQPQRAPQQGGFAPAGYDDDIPF